MKKSSILQITALVAASLAAPQSAMAIDVFLDWDGSLVNMATAWSGAGYGPGEELSPMELSGIIAMSKGKLEAKYAGYTVSFLDSAPGGLYEWVMMGATTASTTTYGSSSGLDWRNKVKDGGAEIYLANFGPILSKAMFSRAENIARFTSAIANTTAHELGHSLGLQHYDAYGIPTVHAPLYGFTGEQNGSIMATGVTGLIAADRGHDRFFNPIEKLKLEYADGVAPLLGKTVAEAAGAKDTLATAQTVLGMTLPISHATAVNVEGKADFGGQTDIYRFFADAGSLLTANTLSHGHLLPFTDTTITLMDSSGAPMLMSEDIHFFLDDFMTPSSAYYSDDSLIFNFMAPYTGTYYMKVAGLVPGDYNLLLSGVSAVPEPSGMVAVAIGLWLFRRRNARRRA